MRCSPQQLLELNHMNFEFTIAGVTKFSTAKHLKLDGTEFSQRQTRSIWCLYGLFLLKAMIT